MILSQASFTPWPDEEFIEARFFSKAVSNDSLENIFPDSKVFSLKQTHSSTIHEIKKIDEVLPSGDGLITLLPNVALTIHTADCLPLLGFSGHIIGACHGGWRGIAQGIIENWIAKFKGLGAEAKTIKVAIGPAIGSCHFEVKNDVAEILIKDIPDKLLKTIKLKHSDPSKSYISLRELARFKLLRAGLVQENLAISEECTFCKPGLYYSFRRDGAQNGQRLEAVIVKAHH